MTLFLSTLALCKFDSWSSASNFLTCSSVLALFSIGLKPTTNVTKLCSILGLYNVFRRFGPNFARTATVLRKKATKELQKHFEDLTAKKLCAMHKPPEEPAIPPTLAITNAEGKYTLDTSECNVKVEHVLLQEQLDGTAQVIGYWTRSLAKAGQAYDTS